jgi:hypothetical protein
MLSCQQTQNVIDGKKRIILNPTEGQRKDFETVTFAEGEVYGIDILVSSDDGKVKVISIYLFSFQLLAFFDPYQHVDTGAVGRIANDYLSARPYGIVPAQDENVTCSVLGGAEESRAVPVQCAGA